MSDSRALAGRVPYVIVAPSAERQRFAYHAFQILRAAYAVLFIVAGADKFFHQLSDWDTVMLAPVAARIPVSPEAFMQLIGAVEFYAGILVATFPRLGAWFIAGWLLAIVANLLMLPDYFDVALRDLGLALGAVALGLLARRQRGPLLPRGL